MPYARTLHIERVVRPRTMRTLLETIEEDERRLDALHESLIRRGR